MEALVRLTRPEKCIDLLAEFDENGKVAKIFDYSGNELLRFNHIVYYNCEEWYFYEPSNEMLYFLSR